MRKTIHAVVAVLVAAAVLGASAQEASPYQVSIVSPSDQSTVFSDTGEMTVQAEVSPALAGGDRLELLVDGRSIAAADGALDFTVFGMARGEHLLQARIIDATGNVAAVSPSDTIYVWAASTLFPNRSAMGASSGSRIATRITVKRG
jgi:hypothetical protein